MSYPGIRSITFHSPQQLPDVVRGLVELVLPPENVDAWLQDPEAFDGQSAMDLLSRRHDIDRAAFRAGVRSVVEVFYRALMHVSVADMPTVEEVEIAVARAQNAADVDALGPSAKTRFVRQTRSHEAHV